MKQITEIKQTIKLWKKLIKENKIVLSLSSLVIMNCFNMLPLLKNWSTNVIIPQSLIDFVLIRSQQASNNTINSPGKLAKINGDLALIQNDAELSDFWNKIYEVICNFEVQNVSEDEIINFKLDNLSFEEVFAKFELNRCQMDSLIIANRQNSIMVCDDLFLRKIANAFGIANVNSTAFIDHIDEDEILKHVMKISKSRMSKVLMISRSWKRLFMAWN